MLTMLRSKQATKGAPHSWGTSAVSFCLDGIIVDGLGYIESAAGNLPRQNRRLGAPFSCRNMR